jgi:hypothetical protein
MLTPAFFLRSVRPPSSRALAPAQYRSRRYPASARTCKKLRYLPESRCNSGSFNSRSPGSAAPCVADPEAGSRVAPFSKSSLRGSMPRPSVNEDPAAPRHLYIRSPFLTCAAASIEVINEPTPGRTRWRVGAIHRAHCHHGPQVARHFDSDHAQFVSGDVVFDHKLRHVAKAKAGTQRACRAPILARCQDPL